MTYAYMPLGGELPKVNESLFVKKYLHDLIFCDSIAKQDKWLEVAVHRTCRVEVVDDITHAPLFWVPPLSYGVVMDDDNEITRICIEADQRIRRHAYSGIHWMKTQLVGRTQFAQPPEEDIAQWLMIIKRYNVPVKLKEGIEANESSNSDMYYEED